MSAMRFPPILLRPPAGFPDFASGYAHEMPVCAITGACGGVFLGAAATLHPSVPVLAATLWVGTILGAALSIRCARFHRVNLSDLDEGIGRLSSAHQRAALERHGGVEALRRGLALKWMTPNLALVATAVATGLIIQLFTHAS